MRLLLLSACALAACGRAPVPEPVLGDAVAHYLEAAVLADPTPTRCAYARLGQRADTLYAWVRCDAASGQGASLPMALMVGPYGRPTAHHRPGDGARYAADLERLFPPDVRHTILQGNMPIVRRLKAALADSTRPGTP